MVPLHAETFEIATTEGQSTEVGVNGLQQALGGGVVQMLCGDVWPASVAVDADLLTPVSYVTFAESDCCLWLTSS